MFLPYQIAPETKHENAQGRVALLVAILVGSYLCVITPHKQREE
jgi:hypothetical protein